MMLQGLHSNIPRPLTLQRRSFLHKKLNQKNIGNVLASKIWAFCVDIINDSDWNCGYSKEELAFSSHLRHLESQLECYNLQRQNYLGGRHQSYSIPKQVVPVAAVHKIVSLSIWSWDVMKPEPFLGLSPLRCLLMLAMLEPFLNAVFTPKDSVTLLLRIQNLKTKKWVFQKI